MMGENPTATMPIPVVSSGIVNYPFGLNSLPGAPGQWSWTVGGYPYLPVELSPKPKLKIVSDGTYEGTYVEIDGQRDDRIKALTLKVGEDGSLFLELVRLQDGEEQVHVLIEHPFDVPARETSRDVWDELIEGAGD